MKTVFRKGMKVYDQFNSPDMEGVVVEVIDNECDDYPIGVSFLKYDICYYTPEGRFNKRDIPTLSTKPYKVEFQGFEQKAPVPTFEEAWNNSHNSKEIFYSSNCDKVCSGYPTQELADASEALRRLLFLRDYYNEGWQPDWNDNATKYSIEVEVGEIVGRNHHCNARIMSFKTNDVRNKFLEEQKELLEIAKPLL